jgi:hypothetical protein
MEGGNIINTVIPITPHQEQSPELPEKLQKILDALAEYHKICLQKNTLNTQEPKKIEDIRQYFKKVYAEICDYIEDSKNTPTLLQDPDFQKMFGVLKECTREWDADISVLVPHWCNLMFIQFPFTISHNHIQSLRNNNS